MPESTHPAPSTITPDQCDASDTASAALTELGALPRMEVLYLPDDESGQAPFALVVSGATFPGLVERDLFQERLDAFARRCGACAAMVIDLPVEVV